MCLFMSLHRTKAHVRFWSWSYVWLWDSNLDTGSELLSSGWEISSIQWIPSSESSLQHWNDYSFKYVLIMSTPQIIGLNRIILSAICLFKNSLEIKPKRYTLWIPMIITKHIFSVAWVWRSELSLWLSPLCMRASWLTTALRLQRTRKQNLRTHINKFWGHS